MATLDKHKDIDECMILYRVQHLQVSTACRAVYNTTIIQFRSD